MVGLGPFRTNLTQPIGIAIIKFENRSGLLHKNDECHTSYRASLC